MSTLENNVQLPQFQQEEESRYISMGELFKICLNNWYWFLISVIVCVLAGYYYTIKTEPTYLRSASLLCRDDMKGTGSNDVSGVLNSFGIPTSRSDVYNEIFVIKSPIIMEEVVRKLNLNVSYDKIGFIRNSTLYGAAVPYNVEFLEESVYGKSFVMELKDGKHILNDFKYYNGSDWVDEDYDVPFDPAKIDTLSTPVGKIIVRPNAGFLSDEPVDMDVLVSYSSIYSTVERLINSITSQQPEEHASIIDITLEDTSTERANDILNTLIECYNKKWIDDRNEIAKATSQFITERLNVLESELGNVDSNISDFKSKNLLPDVNAVSAIYLNRNEKNNSELFELENQRQMVKYIREFLSNPQYKESVLPANSGVGSASLEAQIAEYNKTVLNYKTLLNNSSDKNPIVADLSKIIAESRAAIMESLDNLYVTLSTQIANLQASTAQTNSKISGAPVQTKYLLSVERQQKVKEALYIYLLQKREENEIGQTFTPSNVRIISYARGSTLPVAPKRTNILLVSFVLGLLLPFGIIFVYESLNTTVRSKQDLESLEMPFLGEVPYHGRLRHRWERALKINKPEKEIGFIVKSGGDDPTNEALRIVRSNVSYLMKSFHPSDKCKVLMITSAIPHSGKTFITKNLGAAYALKGKKVLLVDMDMRRHALSQNYKEARTRGISTLLSGEGNASQYIVRNVNNIDTLSLLGSGPVPPNPTELLENGKLADIINSLRDSYDVIILDCPPLHVVSDAQTIANVADMTIFVIRVGNLERAYLPEITKIYKSGKYNHLAVILNGVSNKFKFGYGYGYGYGNYK